MIAASTLYTAWDNSYSSVQAAREDWYSLRLSQLHFDVELLGFLYNSTDVIITFEYLGQTISGNVVVLHNGTYVSSVDLGYLIPNNNYTITVKGGGADESGATNTLVLAFDNGCIWGGMTYYYNSTNSVYDVTGISTQCPTEVS